MSADEAEAGRHRRPARLPTGIPGFDTLTEGGIVAGRSALLVGTSGSGKTIFGLQFLVEGARQFGEPGVLVTFEEVPEDIVRNGDGFGWDLRRRIASGELTIIDASPDAAATDEHLTSPRWSRRSARSWRTWARTGWCSTLSARCSRSS